MYHKNETRSTIIGYGPSCKGKNKTSEEFFKLTKSFIGIFFQTIIASSPTSIDEEIPEPSL